ncbi:hypothetical protein BUALT_Bualt05G0096600 [Buddleja alternifolia]|uniref:Uncharacterized protein n=1 Tax=Buddleja alternifolia TaxID=168488 RepID=A0AAV6XRD1_9LAMI|nr:hypothetical protein BUALT_Bualt05G0096600 [Buddleja alternifolia]
MAAKSIKISIFVCVISFFILWSGCVAPPREYDHFKLVQQWPPAFCKINKCTTIVHRPNNFTIHGLWPDNKSGPPLNNCDWNIASEYKLIEDKQLVRRLNMTWPDLKRRSTRHRRRQIFWREQWNKHGRCAWKFFQKLFPHDEQKHYFKTALDLKDKFDLLKILQDKQIKPGNEVDVRHVCRNISQATGGQDPIVKCTNYTQNTTGEMVVQLAEIIICFNRNASDVIHCPPRNGSLYIGCPKSNVVHFLAWSPTYSAV